MRATCIVFYVLFICHCWPVVAVVVNGRSRYSIRKSTLRIPVEVCRMAVIVVADDEGIYRYNIYKRYTAGYRASLTVRGLCSGTHTLLLCFANAMMYSDFLSMLDFDSQERNIKIDFTRKFQISQRWALVWIHDLPTRFLNDTCLCWTIERNAYYTSKILLCITLMYETGTNHSRCNLVETSV